MHDPVEWLIHHPVQKKLQTHQADHSAKLKGFNLPSHQQQPKYNKKKRETKINNLMIGYQKKIPILREIQYEELRDCHCDYK